jgi:hypothetical protein
MPESTFSSCKQDFQMRDHTIDQGQTVWWQETISWDLQTQKVPFFTHYFEDSYIQAITQRSCHPRRSRTFSILKERQLGGQLPVKGSLCLTSPVERQAEWEVDRTRQEGLLTIATTGNRISGKRSLTSSGCIENWIKAVIV